MDFADREDQVDSAGQVAQVDFVARAVDSGVLRRHLPHGEDSGTEEVV